MDYEIPWTACGVRAGETKYRTDVDAMLTFFFYLEKSERDWVPPFGMEDPLPSVCRKICPWCAREHGLLVCNLPGVQK
jgi:hypothetical protein